MVFHQPLKALHNHRGQCYGTVVVHTGWGGVLGHRDDGGHLEACGDCGLCKREMEYGGEHCSEKVSAGPDDSF